MNQLTHYKHKIDFLILNDTSLSQRTQTIAKSKYKKEKCNECNKRRKPLDKSHQICHVCYKIKKLLNVKLSGNNIIDDFIKYSQTNLIKMEGKMEFVPYNQFQDIEFIAEGGFSKIYKATWVNGPIKSRGINCKNISRSSNHTVVLKKLNNSKNITSRELNELKVFYNYYTKWKTKFDNYCKLGRSNKQEYRESLYHRFNGVSNYYGITQDLNTQDFMIIMPYFNKGDLIHYICDDFYNIKWAHKLDKLVKITNGLINIHSANIIHRDLHSGNILIADYDARIGDLGISKSATESKDNNENYGIIPYMAPEIFQGQKYTVASDIYSFGMIMWEFMTGRRPFWDRNHDTYLIIDICDGLRPPIVTNAPDGYIELMEECWHSDPSKRPQAVDIYNKIDKMNKEEYYHIENPTKIIRSSNIGPVTTNHSGAIYKSRPLSGMINSAMSIRSSRWQSLDLEKIKRKFEDNNDNGQSIKRNKLFENDNDDYFTKEFELDIVINSNYNGGGYITKEHYFDINF